MYRDIQTYIAQQQQQSAHQLPPGNQLRPPAIQQPPAPPPQLPIPPTQNLLRPQQQLLHHADGATPLAIPTGPGIDGEGHHNVPPIKDRSRPRGRMTPYAFYVQERRQYYRQHGIPVSFTAFSKECSALWKELTSEEKLRYQKMSEEDKERYTKETATYNASLGQIYSKDKKFKKGRRRKDPGQPKRNM